MQLVQDLWLRGQSAQQSMLQLAAYNLAFAGTATLQGIQATMNAPLAFWDALGRASASGGTAPAAEPAPQPVSDLSAEALAPAKSAPEPQQRTPQPHLLDEPRGGVADDLTELTGVGAKLAQALNDFGIFHFDQIADLDETGVDWLNAQQSGFRMLAARYKLIEQAKDRNQ